jgi:hypothetical protein
VGESTRVKKGQELREKQYYIEVGQMRCERNGRESKKGPQDQPRESRGKKNHREKTGIKKRFQKKGLGLVDPATDRISPDK